MKFELVLASVALLSMQSAMAQGNSSSGVSFTIISKPLSVSELVAIGRMKSIAEVERKVGAKGRADSFAGSRGGECSDYSFAYGHSITADHFKVQFCDNGYRYLNGVSHDQISVTSNSEGVLDCHRLFSQTEDTDCGRR
jgi:hypothetical protein